MDQEKINAEIVKIQESLGMNGTVIAKAMGIAVSSFHKRRGGKDPKHTFNEKNLNDLKFFLKKTVENILR